MLGLNETKFKLPETIGLKKQGMEELISISNVGKSEVSFENNVTLVKSGCRLAENKDLVQVASGATTASKEVPSINGENSQKTIVPPETSNLENKLQQLILPHGGDALGSEKSIDKNDKTFNLAYILKDAFKKIENSLSKEIKDKISQRTINDRPHVKGKEPLKSKNVDKNGSLFHSSGNETKTINLLDILRSEISKSHKAKVPRSQPHNTEKTQHAKSEVKATANTLNKIEEKVTKPSDVERRDSEKPKSSRNNKTTKRKQVNTGGENISSDSSGSPKSPDSLKKRKTSNSDGETTPTSTNEAKKQTNVESTKTTESSTKKRKVNAGSTKPPGSKGKIFSDNEKSKIKKRKVAFENIDFPNELRLISDLETCLKNQSSSKRSVASIKKKGEIKKNKLDKECIASLTDVISSEGKGAKRKVTQPSANKRKKLNLNDSAKKVSNDAIFDYFIRKIAKDLFQGDIKLSRQAMSAANTFVNDMLTRLCSTAASLLRNTGRHTITHKDIESSVRLIFPDVLVEKVTSKAKTPESDFKE